MLTTVFLSLSGADSKFVENVHNNLPDGLAFFYPKSFENGEILISAMEERIGESRLFVFFASKISVKSIWVNFELDRARLAKIKDRKFKYLVFPIDKDVSYKDLPGWMQEGWIGVAGQSAKDVARYLRGVIAGMAEESGARLPPLGRGGLVDSARREYQAVSFSNKRPPNVFLFSGHAGIGRRTVERLMLPAVLPAAPDLRKGPEFELPPLANLSDIYRAIRQEIEGHISLASFEGALAKFTDAPLDQQVEEIWKSLEYFSNLGQAITIVVGQGLYEDRGVLKPWAAAFLNAAARHEKVKLCLISGRQLKAQDLRALPHVLPVRVDELGDGDIRTLILETIPIFNGVPALPSDLVIQSIGGHPTVARSVARLLAIRGPAFIEGDVKQLHDIQEEVLSESLSFTALNHIERDVLSILSWVPRLNGKMLSEVIRAHHSVTQEQFAEVVEYLLAGCLIQVSGANYLISSPIRGMFRRKHGYGSVDLRTKFSIFLKMQWDEAVSDDDLRIELFDAFVYMIALEGGTLPKEFSGLLLPSALQDIVRDAYDRRHNDDDALKRVVKWGTPALGMKMDEHTREEILSYLIRAQVRLQMFSEASELLKIIKRLGYRSSAYLEAFFLRLSGGDLDEAISRLRAAREIGKYKNSVIADLAICFKLRGRWADLAALIKEEKDRVDKNPVLLDIKIGMLVATGEFDEALREISRLRGKPYDDGRADSRHATILMNRDRNYKAAYEILTDVLNRQTRGANGVRCLRALAAARGKLFDEARRDSEYLKNRPGGEDIFQRIEAEIKLAQRDYPGAESAYRKIRSITAQDKLLKARILEAQGQDIQTSFDKRDVFLNEAAALRAANRVVDEYDFD
jgi:Flp pilus assembly protein TadD